MNDRLRAQSFVKVIIVQLLLVGHQAVSTVTSLIRLSVTPLAVIFTNGTDRVLDQTIFRYVKSADVVAGLLLAISISIQFIITYFQNDFISLGSLFVNRPKAYVIYSRMYNFVVAVSNVCHYRGIKELYILVMDRCGFNSSSLYVSLEVAVATVVLLMSLKACRNIVALPFSVCLDEATSSSSLENWFSVPTMTNNVERHKRTSHVKPNNAEQIADDASDENDGVDQSEYDMNQLSHEKTNNGNTRLSDGFNITDSYVKGEKEKNKNKSEGKLKERLSKNFNNKNNNSSYVNGRKEDDTMKIYSNNIDRKDRKREENQTAEMRNPNKNNNNKELNSGNEDDDESVEMRISEDKVTAIDKNSTARNVAGDLDVHKVLLSIALVRSVCYLFWVAASCVMNCILCHDSIIFDCVLGYLGIMNFWLLLTKFKVWWSNFESQHRDTMKLLVEESYIIGATVFTILIWNGLTKFVVHILAERYWRALHLGRYNITGVVFSVGAFVILAYLQCTCSIARKGAERDGIKANGTGMVFEATYFLIKPSDQQLDDDENSDHVDENKPVIHGKFKS